ncbi:MAG: hypothetical protein JRJ77_19065 [Deltaproteobacteria bacterium]|nr:hypothetical protein [Deltaproteobacteria bacterium]
MKKSILVIHESRLLKGRRAWDEESTMRAERAWFLFRGERSPNGSEIPRWGIERVTNPLPIPS